MADFRIDPSYIASVKGPEPVKISDILGNVRSAQLYETEKEQLKQSQQKTAQGYQDVVNQAIGALAQDPDVLAGKDSNAIIGKIKMMGQYAVRKGVPEQEVGRAVNSLITEAYKDPMSVSMHIGNVMRGGISPSQQISNLTGASTVQGTDISGNPTVVYTDPNTGRKIQVPLAAAGDQSQMRIKPGETLETVGGFQDERTGAKTQAQAAAPALLNIQTVRKYLPLAATGKGSEAIAGLQSVFGNLAGSTVEEKAAAARDIIEKSIADLSIQKNTSLGGKYASDLSAAQQSIATAGKNPTAILKSMELLEPLIQHTVNYQQGLENVIQKYGIQAKRQYDNAMIQSYDPKAIMLYNAFKDKDERAFKELTKGMSDSQVESLGKKMKRYQNLVNGNL